MSLLLVFTCMSMFACSVQRLAAWQCSSSSPLAAVWTGGNTMAGSAVKHLVQYDKSAECT